ncbi:MAG TPA: hypothetical protein VIM87_00075 [Chitinophaga sp.]|uniref:hypothetical protein n=1 Tax=Chitinophaga sp. TaxID=1869181 RepID=UPI002F921575
MEIMSHFHSEYSYLDYWLLGLEKVPNLNLMHFSLPDLSLGVMIHFIEKPWIDNINESKGMRDSWAAIYRYYRRVVDFIRLAGNDIEKRYSTRALSRLYDEIIVTYGQPPFYARPIYMMTIEKEGKEEVVYVGKTESSIRFKSGHFSTLSLLDPDFTGLTKRIYWGSVMVKKKVYGWYPLEFISRKKYASALLNDIESKLIFELQPKFNVYKRRVERTKNTFKLNTYLPFEQVKFIDRDRKILSEKLFADLRRSLLNDKLLEP